MILLKENVTGNKLAKTLGKKNKPKKSSLRDYYTKEWKELLLIPKESQRTLVVG